MSRQDRRAGDDRGFTTVMVAFVMALVLVFAALVIDGGAAYVSHRQSQNASDAGAMAGVQVLEQLKFRDPCPTTTPSPTCTLYSYASLGAQVRQQAQASGADASGVSCWLLYENGNRVSTTNWCAEPFPLAANATDAQQQVAVATAVEVQARQTKPTTFARVIGSSETRAATTAKAAVLNFLGGTSSPFVVCGVQVQQTLTYGYDLIAYDTVKTAWLLQVGAADKYYALQASSQPQCGNNANSLKGLTDGSTIETVPGWLVPDTGNAFSSAAQVAVAGITPCATNAQVFDGCGMLIPIAQYYDNATSRMWIVTWLAWQVWGDGTGGYNTWPKGAGQAGSSCQKPISIKGNDSGMKYCGKLLGAITVTGGKAGGSATSGQTHVVKLIG